MATKSTSPATKRNHLDQPLYWFGMLEIARERDDYALAQRAKEELERLGVKVTYRKRRGVLHG